MLQAHLVVLYEPRERSALIEVILDTTASLIAADLFSYIEANPVAGHFAAVRRPVPDSEEMLRIFAPMASDHPGIRHMAMTGDRQAYRVSDFLSASSWRALPLYTEFMRPERIEHQLGAALPVHAEVTTIVAAHRSGDPDFSDRDRAMLTALAPHAARALLNCDAMSCLEHGGGLMETAPSGRVRWATPVARQLMGMFCGGATRSSDVLPDMLQTLAIEAANAVSRVATRACGTRQLTVRRLPSQSGMLMLLSETEGSRLPMRLEALGFSPREIEVVIWLAQGKSNQQIGEILCISPRTVKKHVGRIFDHLGVDGRTAAALRVREMDGSIS